MLYAAPRHMYVFASIEAGVLYAAPGHTSTLTSVRGGGCMQHQAIRVLLAPIGMHAPSQVVVLGMAPCQQGGLWRVDVKVLELLTVVMVHNAAGHQIVLDAMSHFKVRSPPRSHGVSAMDHHTTKASRRLVIATRSETLALNRSEPSRLFAPNRRRRTSRCGCSCS
jgi:hypothetical protein